MSLLGYQISPDSAAARTSSSLGYLRGTNDERLLKDLGTITINKGKVTSKFTGPQIAGFLNWIAEGKIAEELPELAKTILCDYRNKLARAAADVGTATNPRSAENRLIAEIDAIFRDKGVNPADCSKLVRPMQITGGPLGSPPLPPGPPGPKQPRPMLPSVMNPGGLPPPPPPPPGPSVPLVPGGKDPSAPTPAAPTPAAPTPVAPTPAEPTKCEPNSDPNKHKFDEILDLLVAIANKLGSQFDFEFVTLIAEFIKKFKRVPVVDTMDIKKPLDILIAALIARGSSSIASELKIAIEKKDYSEIRRIILIIKELFASSPELLKSVSTLENVLLPASVMERLDMFEKILVLLRKIEANPGVAADIILELFTILEIKLPDRHNEGIETIVKDAIQKHSAPSTMCLDKLACLKHLLAITCGRSGLMDSLLEYINQMISTLPTSENVAIKGARSKLESVRSAVLEKLEAVDDPLNETSNMAGKLDELLSELAKIPSSTQSSMLISTLEGNVKRRAALQKEIREVQLAMKSTDNKEVMIEELLIQLAEEKKQLESLQSLLKVGVEDDKDMLAYIPNALSEVSGAIDALKSGNVGAVKRILTECHRRNHQYSLFYKLENEKKAQQITELQQRIKQAEEDLIKKLEEAAAAAAAAKAGDLAAATSDAASAANKIRAELQLAQAQLSQATEAGEAAKGQLTTLRSDCGSKDKKISELTAAQASLTERVAQLERELDEERKRRALKDIKPMSSEPSQQENIVPESLTSGTNSVLTSLTAAAKPPVPELKPSAMSFTQQANNAQVSPTSQTNSVVTSLTAAAKPPIPELKPMADSSTIQTNNVQKLNQRKNEPILSPIPKPTTPKNRMLLPASPTPGLNETPKNTSPLQTAIQGPNRTLFLGRLVAWLRSKGISGPEMPKDVEQIYSVRDGPKALIPRFVQTKYETVKPLLEKLISTFDLAANASEPPKDHQALVNLINSVLAQAMEKMPRTNGGTRKNRKIERKTRKSNQ